VLHPFNRRFDETDLVFEVEGRELLARMTKGGSASELDEA